MSKHVSLLASGYSPFFGPIWRRGQQRALSATSSSGPTPAEQIAAMNPTVWYDPSDLSTVWQDAGSTPGVVDSVVGRIEDKSGNGHHANQATGSFKPILRLSGGLYSMQFDALDDFLLTSAIDLTGTDKVTIFLAVRKLSDAATAQMMEFSASNTNNGIFSLSGPATPTSLRFVLQSRGTVTATSSTSSASFDAPVSAVLTGICDISGQVADLRINGSVAVSNGTSQGSGNFGNHALYLGRRGGASNPFNGHQYGALVFPRICTAGEIEIVEAFLASKAGVTL